MVQRYLNKNHIITAVVSYKHSNPDYKVKENYENKKYIPIGKLKVIDKWGEEQELNVSLERLNRNLQIFNIPCSSKGIYIYDEEFDASYITMRPFIAILFLNNVTYVHAFDSDEELNNWTAEMGLDKFFNSKDMFCPDNI